MTKAELYKKACMLPLLPGVYIIRDKSDTIIYIGKAMQRMGNALDSALVTVTSMLH